MLLSLIALAIAKFGVGWNSCGFGISLMGAGLGGIFIGLLWSFGETEEDIHYYWDQLIHLRAHFLGVALIVAETSCIVVGALLYYWFKSCSA